MDPIFRGHAAVHLPPGYPYPTWGPYGPAGLAPSRDMTRARDRLDIPAISIRELHAHIDKYKRSIDNLIDFNEELQANLIRARGGRGRRSQSRQGAEREGQQRMRLNMEEMRHIQRQINQLKRQASGGRGGGQGPYFDGGYDNDFSSPGRHPQHDSLPHDYQDNFDEFYDPYPDHDPYGNECLGGRGRGRFGGR